VLVLAFGPTSRRWQGPVVRRAPPAPSSTRSAPESSVTSSTRNS
jgi:hypothetical protein